MVEVISLTNGGRPPRGEHCLVVEWSDKPVSSFMKVQNGLHDRIGRPKHRFWSTEAILLAQRLGFAQVYYVGTPEEVGWPVETRQHVGRTRGRRNARRGARAPAGATA